MFKNWKSLIAPVLAAVFVVTAAQGALYQWSKTAATNATADASINWSEGMSPSSVNDSARAMMARIAEWRDDLSGLLSGGGGAPAYVLTSNQGLPATPTNGQAIAFVPNVTNSIGVTLQVDGGNIYPIHSAAGTAIGAAVMIAGAPYTVKFSSSASAWVLHGFYGSPFVIPIGGVVDYVGTTSPNSNFVFPVGQCISRTTYSVFFTLVSTRYGVCDGSTTFAVPDWRGSILAVQDNLGGSARGLITTAGSGCDGTTLGTQCGAQTVTLAQSALPNIAPAFAGTIGNVSVVGGSSGVVIGGSLIAAGGPDVFGGTAAVQLTSTGTFTPVGNVASINGGVTQTTVNKLPPLQIVTKLIRIF